MTTYEVHYQKGKDYGETLIEAEYPQQAQLKFLEQQQDPEIIVLCVHTTRYRITRRGLSRRRRSYGHQPGLQHHQQNL